MYMYFVDLHVHVHVFCRSTCTCSRHARHTIIVIVLQSQSLKYDQRAPTSSYRTMPKLGEAGDLVVSKHIILSRNTTRRSMEFQPGVGLLP